MMLGKEANRDELQQVMTRMDSFPFFFLMRSDSKKGPKLRPAIIIAHFLCDAPCLPAAAAVKVKLNYEGRLIREEAGKQSRSRFFCVAWEKSQAAEQHAASSACYLEVGRVVT